MTQTVLLSNYDNTIPSIIHLLLLSAITIVLEAPVLLLGFSKSKYKYKILLICLVNTLTNASLNTLINYLGWDYNSYFFMSEAVIVVIEAVIYYLCIYDISMKRAFATSFVANLYSVFFGSIFIFSYIS